MLIVQQNYGKRYEYTISVLEAALSLKVLVIYIQKSFLENQNLTYVGFNLYWLSGMDNR